MAGTFIGQIIAWTLRAGFELLVMILEFLIRMFVWLIDHGADVIGADFPYSASQVNLPTGPVASALIVALGLVMLIWIGYDLLDGVADRPAMSCLILIFSVGLAVGGPVGNFIDTMTTGGQQAGQNTIGRVLPGQG